MNSLKTTIVEAGKRAPYFAEDERLPHRPTYPIHQGALGCGNRPLLRPRRRCDQRRPRKFHRSLLRFRFVHRRRIICLTLQPRCLHQLHHRHLSGGQPHGSHADEFLSVDSLCRDPIATRSQAPEDELPLVLQCALPHEVPLFVQDAYPANRRRCVEDRPHRNSWHQVHFQPGRGGYSGAYSTLTEKAWHSEYRACIPFKPQGPAI